MGLATPGADEGSTLSTDAYPVLQALHHAGIGRLVGGPDASALTAELEHLSRRMAQPGSAGEAARLALLGSATVQAHASVAALSALLGQLVAKRDVANAHEASRLLTDATKRYARLHEALAKVQHRPLLVVGHAERVTMGATP